MVALQATSVIIDLFAVSFMDSSGIGALVTLRNELRTRKDTLSLTRPQRNVRRVLQIMGLDQMFGLDAD